MMYAVNSLGRFRFMTVEGNATATMFEQFLERLITGAEQKIVLIADGHPAHKAKLVQCYIEENRGRIGLFSLPTYAPELNPDELNGSMLKPGPGRRQRRPKFR